MLFFFGYPPLLGSFFSTQASFTLAGGVFGRILLKRLACCFFWVSSSFGRLFQHAGGIIHLSRWFFFWTHPTKANGMLFSLVSSSFGRLFQHAGGIIHLSRWSFWAHPTKAIGILLFWVSSSFGRLFQHAGGIIHLSRWFFFWTHPTKANGMLFFFGILLFWEAFSARRRHHSP